MKRIYSILFSLSILYPDFALGQNGGLRLRPDNYRMDSITLPAGGTVTFKAYETLYYVSNVADSQYQYLNIYIPETVPLNGHAPVFLKTNVGGYMAARASAPSATDAAGRALAEGYVVVIPGSRGRNSTVEIDGKTVYTGRAPAGIVDLKAAVRYIRNNADLLPVDTERIVTDGTSAGGAMSALLGATGNHPAYENYLAEAGAADQCDNVFAAVCYCPITDIEHADMAYEWLYNGTRIRKENITSEQRDLSGELARMYPEYLESLGLEWPRKDSGVGYEEFLKSFLISSAQRARNEGGEIPGETGVVFNRGYRNSPGEFVIDIDMDVYLDYIAGKQPLKQVPAFDAMGVASERPTPENDLFGDHEGIASNFTEFGMRRSGEQKPAADLKERIYLMNPMNFIGVSESRTAPYWYIRHGASDRDTAFTVPVNLAAKLQENGHVVNFRLPWNRPHSGDYNLDDLFNWLGAIIAD